MGALDQPAPLSTCSGLELWDHQADRRGKARITPMMIDAAMKLPV
jgi:hypothetical protein